MAQKPVGPISLSATAQGKRKAISRSNRMKRIAGAVRPHDEADGLGRDADRSAHQNEKDDRQVRLEVHRVWVRWACMLE
jgi:hypothetical protein